MIKFTDVLKANVRYFYVLIISMLVFFAIVFGVKYETNDYEAVNNTYYITIGSEPATQTETEAFYGDVSVIVNNVYFYDEVVKRLQQFDSSRFSGLKASDIKNNLKFEYDKKSNRITASIIGKNKDNVELILKACLNTAMEKYEEKPGSLYELKEWYPISIKQYETKNGMYAIIGLLVGLVVGEIIITCLVAFLPYVQDREMLERIVGLNVLTTLKKEGK